MSVDYRLREFVNKTPENHVIIRIILRPMAFHLDKRLVSFLTMTELNYLMRKIAILKIVMIRLEIWRQGMQIR